MTDNERRGITDLKHSMNHLQMLVCSFRCVVCLLSDSEAFWFLFTVWPVGGAAPFSARSEGDVISLSANTSVHSVCVISPQYPPVSLSTSMTSCLYESNITITGLSLYVKRRHPGKKALIVPFQGKSEISRCL